MSSKLSVEQILANLSQRAALHRNKEAFHAQQEIHHREQRALHAAELAKVEQSLEALQAVVPSAIELAAPVRTSPAPAISQVALPAEGRLMVSRLLRQIALSPDLAEPFGPTSLVAAANRAFADRLPRPVGPRTASDVLRRMLAAGEIQLARDGKAFHEALYVRRPGKG
ncbi:MAG: hypothetical protein ABUT39_00525 [Acidobacteriota bacterium]